MRKAKAETTLDYGDALVIERPNGFYWKDKATGQEFGPFPTLLAATEDMGYNEEEQEAPTEALHEAEDELGISDWIDPDTGIPAEGSGPHIDDN